MPRHAFLPVSPVPLIPHRHLLFHPFRETQFGCRRCQSGSRGPDFKPRRPIENETRVRSRLSPLASFPFLSKDGAPSRSCRATRPIWAQYARMQRDDPKPPPRGPPKFLVSCALSALALASLLHAPSAGSAAGAVSVASALENSDLPLVDQQKREGLDKRFGHTFSVESYDPFNLHGRLAPKSKEQPYPKPGDGDKPREPSAARDPNVHMRIFWSQEDGGDVSSVRSVVDGSASQGGAPESDSRPRRRPPPKTYDEALYAQPDVPLDIVFVENLKLAGSVGAAVLSVVLFVSVAERVSVPRSEALPTAYDRERIQRYCLQRPEKVLARMSIYAFEFIRYAIRSTTDKVLDSLWLGGQVGKRVRRRQRAQALREGITRLGPGVIKLGQAAASRPDLVGRTFASELQLLQDSIFQGFPSEEAFALIREELNAKVDDVYAYIDPNPVAGASLGMVFRAWLFEEEEQEYKRSFQLGDPKDDKFTSEMDLVERVRPELRGKRRVAVKVQRPQVAELCSLDFFIVRRLAVVVGKVFNTRTNLGMVVDEYASSVFEELNYVNEARNVQKFRELYCSLNEKPDALDGPSVYVPRVYPMYSSRRVLTTEWLDLESLTDAMARVRPGDLRLVESGIRSALDQCLSTGFVHCDQHSGNLMKLRDGRPGCEEGGLALVDFGICAQIPEYTRQSMACALMHLMHRDYMALADSFAGMSLMRGSDLDTEVEALSEALASAFRDVSAVDVSKDSNIENDPEESYRAQLQRFTFVGVAERLIALCDTFPLVFRDYFLSILRSLAMLEGLAFSAKPDFNIVDLVYPHVVSMVLTGSDSTPFRPSLRRLVLTSDSEPGKERVSLVALERLVRLSRPGALVTTSPQKFEPAQGGDREAVRTDGQSTSVLKYALSRKGSLSLMLTVGQLEQDHVALGKDWIDRVVFRQPGANPLTSQRSGTLHGGVRTESEDEVNTCEQNVQIVRHVLRRESRTRIGFWHRFKLSRVSLKVALFVFFRIGYYFAGRSVGTLVRGIIAFITMGRWGRTSRAFAMKQ